MYVDASGLQQNCYLRYLNPISVFIFNEKSILYAKIAISQKTYFFPNSVLYII